MGDELESEEGRSLYSFKEYSKLSQALVTLSQSIKSGRWSELLRVLTSSLIVSRMDGCYKVEENVNFEAFLRVMGVTDEAQVERMIAATKEVTLTDNGDGTWTQVSGLKTSTFPINKEYKVGPKLELNIQENSFTFQLDC